MSNCLPSHHFLFSQILHATNGVAHVTSSVTFDIGNHDKIHIIMYKIQYWHDVLSACRGHGGLSLRLHAYVIYESQRGKKHFSSRMDLRVYFKKLASLVLFCSTMKLADDHREFNFGNVRELAYPWRKAVIILHGLHARETKHQMAKWTGSLHSIIYSLSDQFMHVECMCI